MNSRKIKIISGGQSGADIGGLMAGLAARERGLPVEVGGWGHPELDTEYAPRPWSRTPNPVENIAENERIVALQRQAGVVPWPNWVTRNAGFGRNERPDIIEVHGKVSPGRPPQGQHFPRTAGNVLDSDATVLFSHTGLEGGTRDTKDIAEAAGKPWVLNPTPQELADFIKTHGVGVLNIAGRRESKSPSGKSHQAMAQQTVSDALQILYGDGAPLPAAAAAASALSPSAPKTARLLFGGATAIKRNADGTNFHGNDWEATQRLSNYATLPVPVVYRGVEFPTVEQAYVAAKMHEAPPELLQFIATLPGGRNQYGKPTSPAQVARNAGRSRGFQGLKALGWTGPLPGMTPDWNTVKLEVMEDLVRQKFTRNPELGKFLVGTGDQELIEHTTNWNDPIWGMVDPLMKETGRLDPSRLQGENHLGRILMKVRQELAGGGTPKAAPTQEQLELFPAAQKQIMAGSRMPMILAAAAAVAAAGGAGYLLTRSPVDAAGEQYGFDVPA